MASSQCQNQKQKCSVFVGNIPYDASEEQITALLKEAGPVVRFELITDKDCGRPKGFGFCVYKDQETASSAVRNLQGCEINGRTLRIALAAQDKPKPNNPNLNDHDQPIGLRTALNAAFIMAGSPQQADALTHHLSNMSRTQLVQFVSETKAIAENDKELARQMLLENPQLRKGLLQAQIMLGMVTPDMMRTVNASHQQRQHHPIPKIGEPMAAGPQFPQEIDPALMQQVLSLTPDKLNALPPHVQQQVIQMQQDYQKILCSR